MKKFYQLVITVFFIILAGSAGAAELKLYSVYPAMGKFGKDLQVTLTGTGFDANTRVSMYPGSGIMYPATESIIGSVDTPGNAMDVAVAGNIAYVADDSSGLQVIDVSDLSQPQIIGSVGTIGNARSVAVAGNIAFVACYGGLRVIDISNPSQPEIIGSANTPGSAYGVAVAGNTAFVAERSGGLQVIDVSIPSQPEIIASADTPGSAYGVAISGNTAFVADWGGGLQVIDVSTPSQPQIIGSVETPGDATGLAISDNILFVADDSGGLQVIDVSTLSEPKIIGSVETPGNAYGVTVVGNTAYVADGYEGLQVIDVSTPSQPVIIGSVDMPGSVYGVAVIDDTAFVANGSAGFAAVTLKAVTEIIPVTVNSETEITLTLPCPPATGNWTLRVFNNNGYDVLPDAVNFYEVRLDSVYPTLGELGEDLKITLEGDGFDENTRVSMYPDTGNKRSIIGSLDTLGSAEAIAVVGDIAFVACGGYEQWKGGLQVFDISTPSQPEIIGSVETPDEANGIAVVSDNVFLACDDSGLQVIDVSTPSQPRIVGSVETPDDVYGVAVAGNIAYVTEGYYERLQVIDISNPSQPEIISSVDTPGSAYGVAVAGNTVYVGCGNEWRGVRVIDVSNPFQPKVIGSAVTSGSVLGLEIIGDTVYAGCASGAYYGEWGGLQVIDVSEPSRPKIISSIDILGDVYGVTVVGTTAFVTNGYGGLQAIDISTPSQPEIIGAGDTPGHANEVAVIGDTAFIAGGNGGLQISDVSMLYQSKIIGSVDTPGTANEVAVSGGTAFVVCGDIEEWNGLLMIDVSTPSHHKIISSVETAGIANAVAVVGDIAYVGCYRSGFDLRPLWNGLQLIDVSTPSQLQFIGSAETPDGAFGIAVAGDMAYVADWSDGLQVIDVNDLFLPKIIGTVETPGIAYKIVVVGNIAFVADRSEGLQIIDVSTPSQPQIISSVQTSGWAYGLAVTDNIVLAACGYEWNGLQIVDISTLSQPKSIGYFKTPDSATGVAIAGDIAYVADSSGALLAIDVSEPSQPNLIGSVEIPVSPNGVTLSGDTLYLAGSTGLITVPLKAVTEITPVTVNSETQITATLPSPPAPGHWTLRVFKGDEYDELPGAVTFSEPETYGRQTQKKAVIVAGGGPYPGNTLWEATQMCANYAYRALLYQGYTRENIYYLSPDTAADVDGDGFFNDTDADATVANFSHALNIWAKDPESPASELLIYMTDHGGPGTFRINEYEILKAEDLGRWLDDLQETMPGKILFVYDACEAGSFLSELVPRPGKERILITSAEADKPAHFLYKGSVSFSFQFWAHIYMGSDVADAFFFAEEMVKKRQKPQIDADGDGIPNEKADRDLVINFVIGRGYVPASDMPSIRDISGEQTLNGEPGAKIWAGPATDSNGIKRVWGIIVPPGYIPESADTPVTDLPSFELFDTDQDGIYEAEYTGFNTQGFYKITVYAEDLQGMYSLPLHTAVIQTDGKAVLKGDLSGNWKIDTADMIIALKVLSGTDDSGLAWSDYAASGADTNGDGKLGFEELFYIFKTLAKA